MSVGAVGPVGGSGSVYAVSPYLNGVTRASDAVTAAETVTVAAAATAALQLQASAAASHAQAAAIAAPVTPFANPAIAQIAQKTDVSGALAASAPVPADAVLQGDSGLLVQSYGAVALIEPPLALAQIYTQPVVPAIPPVAPVTRIARTELRAY